MKQGWYVGHGKRWLDLFLALSLFLLLLPVVGLIAVVILMVLGRPVLFLQSRPGMNERLFRMIKFRTMQNLGSRPLKLEEDERRLTPFGRLLRSTSLDEIPELINVIKGEMSLVGPRPLLTRYLDLYTPEQRRRHELRPGITGWAQIQGRNELSWEERFRKDVWYVDNVSLVLDLKILATTVWKIMLREGVSEQGKATVSEFQGSGPGVNRIGQESGD